MSISSYDLEEREVAEFLLINGDRRLTPQYRYSCRLCGFKTLWHNKLPEIELSVISSLDNHADRMHPHPEVVNVPSSCDLQSYYQVTISPDGEHIRCTCLGFAFRKTCRHTSVLQEQHNIRTLGADLGALRKDA